MKLSSLLVCGAALGSLLTAGNAALPQGSAFTYQGWLNDGVGPASGSYDLTFTLYTNSTLGSAIAGPVTNIATGVTNGLFTATSDFGANCFLPFACPPTPKSRRSPIQSG